MYESSEIPKGKMTENHPLRVGYWWSSKKSLKFNVKDFAEVCTTFGFELAKLDFESSLDEQGPFDAIVHKLSNSMLEAKAGNLQAKDICHKFHEYVERHPNIVVIDPLEKLEAFLDRYEMYKLLQKNELGTNEDSDIFVPAFVELTTTNVKENLAKMKESGIDFPIVCKPSPAHGPCSHEMCIIFNEAGLQDVQPPCVIQKFINHNAILHKIFIIGDKYFIRQRPSLKNFVSGEQKTVFFNSHLVSKPNSASELTKLDDVTEEHISSSCPSTEMIEHIVVILNKSLGLTLLGVDIIVDNKTGHYAIIDINPFPGYDEVDNFFKLLCDFIKKKVSLQAATINNKDEKSACNSVSFPAKANGKLSSAIIPYSHRCFCCPISGFCLNSSQKSIVSSNLSFDCSHLNESPVKPLCEEKKTDFHTQELHEDSGIETSDSCDEKKKDTNCRMTKRQHSRNNHSLCFTGSELG